MRILVISDSHGNIRQVERALQDTPQAKIVIHLGDGADDITDLEFVFPEKQFYQVAGNCDRGCILLPEQEFSVLNKRIFITHGHAYSVKTGLHCVKTEAHRRQADIVLFGHTHLPVTEYDNGLYLFNPGSLSGTNPTYGLLEITEDDISMQILKIQE